jgi:hypothetical protein
MTEPVVADLQIGLFSVIPSSRGICFFLGIGCDATLNGN